MTRSILCVGFSALALSAGCSDERVSPGRERALDLSRYSLVEGAIAGEPADATALYQALRISNRDLELSILRDGVSAVGGVVEDDDVMGIVCRHDASESGASCVLYRALVRTEHVTGEPSSEGLVSASRAKLTGTIATKLAEALPARADARDLRSAGSVTCTVHGSGAECAIPLVASVSGAARIDLGVAQVRKELGDGAARDLADKFGELLRRLFP